MEKNATDDAHEAEQTHRIGGKIRYADTPQPGVNRWFIGLIAVVGIAMAVLSVVLTSGSDSSSLPPKDPGLAPGADGIDIGPTVTARDHGPGVYPTPPAVSDWKALYRTALPGDPFWGPILANPIPEAAAPHGSLEHDENVTVIGWRVGFSGLPMEVCRAHKGARVMEVASYTEGDHTYVAFEYTNLPDSYAVPRTFEFRNCWEGAVFTMNRSQIKFD